MLSLKDSVVAVSGGNGGIGFAIAEGVASAGAVVVIWGRNEEKTAAAVERLRSSGARAHGVQFDQSDPTAAKRALEQTLHVAGELDSFVANAGVAGMATRVTDLDFESWKNVMATNLDGTFKVLQEVSRYLIERRKGGAITAVTSIGIQYGAPREAHYVATKAAIGSLVRSFAVALGPHRIRINALAPGWIDTEFVGPGSAFAGSDSKGLRAATVARTPVGRWGTPSDLVPISVYLANAEPQFHTGDVITVDGGYSIG